MDKDRFRYGSIEESRIWVSWFYVVVLVSLWEGCCCIVGVYFGFGKVFYFGISVCFYWYIRIRVVFLSSKNGSLFLFCKGEILYGRRKIKWLLKMS